MVTAYDCTFAQLIDRANVDILLVGDSLGMVVQGEHSTLPVTIDEMAYHTRLVAKARPNALVLGDLPFLSYQTSRRDALENAGKLIKAGAEAVKLEGGRTQASTIRALVRADIPVVAHIGLTPQSVHRMGGHKVQGRDAAGRERLLDDARAVADAGAFAVVLEGVPLELGREITEMLDIPTVGIGAGPFCDGQVLVMHDLLGLATEDRKMPRFVRRYAGLGAQVTAAVESFADDVRGGAFPSDAESYHAPALAGAAPQTYEAPSHLRTIDSVAGMRAWADRQRALGLRIAFVPTMGFLHEGHLSLVREARSRGDRVVVSIFVNPIQFDREEDLLAYPRELERDRRLLEGEGVDVLFTPTAREMYPDEFVSGVNVERLTDHLCGAHRPGHFRGVTTVVSKLFHAVQPLDAAGVPVRVVPGVSSAMASAAAAVESFTLPEVTQSVIFTRVEGRTPMPEGESLAELARHHCTLCIFLSITLLHKVQEQLRAAGWADDAPMLVVHKASWPGEELIIRGTLADIRQRCRDAKVVSQAMVIASPNLGARHWPTLVKSKLYDASFTHRFRKASVPATPTETS